MTQRRKTPDRRDTDAPAPHSLEAERALLGAALVDPRHLTAPGMPAPGDFYRRAHQQIWAALLTLAARGTGIDYLTVSEELRRAEVLEEVGGPAYLSSLTDGMPRAAHAASYAGIVRDMAQRRAVAALGEAIAARAKAGTDEIAALADWATAEVLRVAAGVPRAGFVRMADVVGELVGRLDQPAPGLMTGFAALDELLGGLQPEDLILVAARPSVGKSALAFNIASNVAARGETVGCFSLEMGRLSLALRTLTAEAQVSGYRLRRGWVTNSESEMARITAAFCAIGDWPLWIDDSPMLAVQEIGARARALKAQGEQAGRPLALLIVDYLQLVNDSGDGHDSRQQELSTISKTLKGLARELRIPMVALSQLNRVVESRKTAKPKLSDLRESGALEQDADVVLMLWRPFEEEEREAAVQRIEVVIAKQRNGPANVDTVLEYHKEHTRFMDPIERSDNET